MRAVHICASIWLSQTDVLCIYAQAIIIRLWLMYASQSMRLHLKGWKKTVLRVCMFSFSFEFYEISNNRWEETQNKQRAIVSRFWVCVYVCATSLFVLLVFFLFISVLTLVCIAISMCIYILKLFDDVWKIYNKIRIHKNLSFANKEKNESLWKGKNSHTFTFDYSNELNQNETKRTHVIRCAFECWFPSLLLMYIFFIVVFSYSLCTAS